MAEAVKPPQRVAMTDSQGLVTLPWDTFLRLLSVDVPGELRGLITANQTAIEGLAIEIAFDD